MRRNTGSPSFTTAQHITSCLQVAQQQSLGITTSNAFHAGSKKLWFVIGAHCGAQRSHVLVPVWSVITGHRGLRSLQQRGERPTSSVLIGHHFAHRAFWPAAILQSNGPLPANFISVFRIICGHMESGSELKTVLASGGKMNHEPSSTSLCS
jgi:hypothetical protein